MCRATVIVGIALAASATCAGRQNPGAFAAEAVTTEPELVACAGYQPAPTVTTSRRYATVSRSRPW